MAPQKKRPTTGGKPAPKKGAKGGPSGGGGKKPAFRKKRGGNPFRRYTVELVLGVAIGGLLLGILYLVLAGGDEPAQKRLTAIAPAPVAAPGPMLHFEEKLPPRPVESTQATRVEPVPVMPAPVTRKPVFQPVPAEAHGPMVAVIIDDMGADMEAARRLAAIAAPITFAVLPYLPHSQGVATLAHAKGRPVMLHLPMQPTSKNANPGEGALTVDMDDARLVDAFARALHEVPYVQGVNNHMGSLFTENADKMATVVREVRNAGLFFIDSRTSSRSEGARMAQAIGLPSASRDVFLDNDQEVEKIAANLRTLADKARRNGSAIGIGHPYEETVEALERVMPELMAEGIVFVPAGALVGKE
ncbi:MAG: divergent polysaccharide deacetylase family protein [Nitrospinae bacterium]|nr:divergent polysaccharide deacetylase family protein [Nitrospinota bacterium]